MQLRDAIQDFMLECKVRRLVPRTIDNYGKHLRYLTNYKEHTRERMIFLLCSSSIILLLRLGR